MVALIIFPAAKTSGILAKKIQTDDDVVLHGLSLIVPSVVNFPAQVKKQSHGIARVCTESFCL